MQEGRPSRTAFSVACKRAAHQLIDHRPLVLDDPMAPRIIGQQAAAKILAEPEKQQNPYARGMRAFMVARSRYAEDHLHDAVARGVPQYVVLGAGLDTFAYRNPYPLEALRVFEVDHPDTQLWKRQLLDRERIPAPASLTFVPVDFERQSFAEALAGSGFEVERPAFFSWLGVTPYLTLEAFRATLRAIGSMPGESGVTFEYMLPRSSFSFREKMVLDRLAQKVEAAGEPFQLSFSPDQMPQELTSAGFRMIEEMTTDQINERYFHERRDGLRLYGGVARMITAWTDRGESFRQR